MIPGSGRSPGEGLGYLRQYSWTSLVVQLVKNPPAMQETWVQSLGWEDSLEKGKATHSSILAWRIPWIVKAMRLQRIGLDLGTEQQLLPEASVQLLHQNLNLTDHPSSPKPLGSATHPLTLSAVKDSAWESC